MNENKEEKSKVEFVVADKEEVIRLTKECLDKHKSIIDALKKLDEIK